MKNKYIAGDLVKYLSQVVKIVEVYQDGTCYFGNETMCGQQDCKDAAPITLTPEILEKNGWYGANNLMTPQRFFIRPSNARAIRP